MYIERRKGGARFEYARNICMREDAGTVSRCMRCGRCEKHCPQNIPIREMLKKADRALLPVHYRIGVGVARKIMTGRRRKKRQEQ